jgi:hypothetical protein
MNEIWQYSGNGKSGEENSFNVNGTLDKYELKRNEITNEHMQQSIGRVPAETFAIFHVHPNSTGNLGWMASGPDRTNAFRIKRYYYIVSKAGLGFYDYRTREVSLLRPGLQWINACN